MIIDSSAILAILFDEPEAEAFLATIIASEHRRISTATVVEASMVALGAGEEYADAFDRVLVRLNIEMTPVSIEQVAHARDGFYRFGKRRHRAGLNLGDTFSYGLAMALREPLLFKGDDFSQTDVTPAV